MSPSFNRLCLHGWRSLLFRAKAGHSLNRVVNISTISPTGSHIQSKDSCTDVGSLYRESENRSPLNPPVSLSVRENAHQKSKGFSPFLTDTFSRQHNYLRISVTERCNLRCIYCMPEEGVALSPPSHNLTTAEIVYLSKLFVKQGVTKIRLTGGEPTVRKDIVDLIQQIGALQAFGLKELCITTNGIALHRKLEMMVQAGLTNINLSLDTLDPFQYTLMTRRNGLETVMKVIDKIFSLKREGFRIRFKINCVVMRGVNDREIDPFAELASKEDVEIRFIEYMPFDGNKWAKGKMITYMEMLSRIRQKYPDIQRVSNERGDTSKTYRIPGFVGKLGFITSMTENFCSTCNRLRITSDGNLKVCLFGNNEVSLRDIMREYNDGKPIGEDSLGKLDYRIASPVGTSTREVVTRDPGSRLLEAIGLAVRRKAEKHADLGDLEKMENRPMILIGG